MKTDRAYYWLLGVSLVLLNMSVIGCTDKDQRDISGPIRGEEMGTFDATDLGMYAETSCGGYTSYENPYPCKSACSKNGNCTWWAWKSAKEIWGVSLPKWGNASSWAKNAKRAGYTVSFTPEVNTIAVSTRGKNGHVAWVTRIVGASKIEVSEMACGSYDGAKIKIYSKSYFNGGFIYKKSPDAFPYFSSAPRLATSLPLGNRTYFTGTATDAVGLSKITMVVSGPRGNDITAFSETLYGTSKSLSSYYFDSKNATYANVKGTYSVNFWIKDTMGQATLSNTMTVTVYAEGSVSGIGYGSETGTGTGW